MSDSGYATGDCVHGRKRSECLICTRTLVPEISVPCLLRLKHISVFAGPGGEVLVLNNEDDWRCCYMVDDSWRRDPFMSRASAEARAAELAAGGKQS